MQVHVLVWGALKGKLGGHAGTCTGLGGHSRENWGVMQIHVLVWGGTQGKIGGSCRYMYWFGGALKGKLGDHAKFFRDN